MEWHVAQVNIGRLRARVDDPLIADFVAGLDRINAVADAAPGFVWRLQTEDGNATAIRPVDDDELLAINLSVWESVEALADYVYRSEHVELMRRRREWFERYGTSYLALWWTPAGTIPTVPEAMARIARLDRRRTDTGCVHVQAPLRPTARRFRRRCRRTRRVPRLTRRRTRRQRSGSRWSIDAAGQGRPACGASTSWVSTMPSEAPWPS